MSSPLDDKKNDLIASAGKSILGVVPFAGPLLAEIVDHLVPDQRVDRLTAYVKELESRLSSAEETIVRASLNKPEGLALAEDGYIAASRAVTRDRASYIASVVANGLSVEEMSESRQRYLLNLLSELNDEEVLWLRFFFNPVIDGDHEFRNKHEKIFEPARAYIGAPESEIEKASIQESYKEHLERLGLVESKIQFDRKTGVPEFDKFSGKPRTSYTDITHLGRMLLREIGMIEAEPANKQNQVDE